MRIEFSVNRSHEYFRALVRPTLARVVRRSVVLAVVLAVAGPFLVFVSQGEGVGTVVGFLCVAVAAGVTLRTRKLWVSALVAPDGWTARRTYVITERGLETSTDLTRTWWDWTAIRAVDVRSEAYVFRQDGPIFDVPREPMTGADEAELSELLAAFGLLPKNAAPTSELTKIKFQAR